MAVRNFDGTDDVITCSIGAMSAQDSGPITIIVLVRRKATNEMVPMALHASSGPASDRGRSALDMDAGDSYMINDVGFAAAGFAFDNDTWLIGAVSKAAGTVAPRFHKYVYATTTWTRANSGGTMADGGAPGASGTLRFGQWGTGLFFNGYIAAGAIYNQVLSDATLDGMTATAQSWLDTGPVGMWLLNQVATTTPLSDATGNGANETAIVGTTVVTGDDPPGFDFSLGGGVVSRPRELIVVRRAPLIRAGHF